MTSLFLSLKCRVLNSKLRLALLNSVESLLVSVLAAVALVFYMLVLCYVVSY